MARLTEAERLEAINLVAEIYLSPDGGAGCCLHCVLDDGNDATAFLESYNLSEIKHDRCARLLALLLKMKRTQRRKITTQGHNLADR